jgi:hypothetical protein
MKMADVEHMDSNDLKLSLAGKLGVAANVQLL